jgi:drug/metabolite transporter (DMT)-like permease
VSRHDLALMGAVAALMGLSFVFMKVAVPALGTTSLAAIRTFGAALTLALWSVALGRRIDLKRGAVAYLVLGALSAAIPFSLTGWALLRIPASLGALLMATVPMFAAVMTHALGGERLSARRGAFLVLGLLGVAVVSGWVPIDAAAPHLPSVMAVLVSALCYAAGSITIQRRFAGVERTTMTMGSFLGAAVLLAPTVVLAPPVAMPTPVQLAAVAGLTVVSTALSFLLYYVLIGRVGPAVATSVGFLIPVAGALWGALVLGEPLTLSTVVGGAIVLVAVRGVTARRAGASVAPLPVPRGARGRVAH